MISLTMNLCELCSMGRGYQIRIKYLSYIYIYNQGENTYVYILIDLWASISTNIYTSTLDSRAYNNGVGQSTYFFLN